jgi:nucleoside-diphosphate-sugar epimerase
MRSTILLTGASGVIGRAVAEELADEHVIGLVHSDTDVPEVDEVLRGDTAQPRLGLSESDWKDLAARVDVVIHSAALTEWGQPWPRYQSINIDGTERVIELARAAGAPIHYVSTCFVRAIELGNTAWLGPDNVVAPYIRSKLECERLVRESGQPFAIYRPTNLVGDSRTGGSSRPQIVQLLSEWLCRGKAPYYPSHPGNLVDVLSLDMTAIAIARIVRAGEFGGRYWLTTGPDAMTVQDAQEILFTHARDLGRDLDPVPVVDPSQPLPVPLDQVPATSRAFLKVLIDVSGVVRACGGVLPTSLPELRARHGLPQASDRDAYRLSLKYWAEQRAATRMK